MRIKYLAQGNNILLPWFEPSTSVSKTDILANRPICSNMRGCSTRYTRFRPIPGCARKQRDRQIGHEKCIQYCETRSFPWRLFIKNPSLLRLASTAYATSSHLVSGNETILSETGVQQGYPLEPVLFALAVDEIPNGSYLFAAGLPTDIVGSQNFQTFSTRQTTHHGDR